MTCRRAESNDEARLSQRFSEESRESNASQGVLSPAVRSQRSSSELRPSPAIPEPAGAVLSDGWERRGAPSSGSASPDGVVSPPILATPIPDEVGAPKRSDFSASFAQLSASLAGRPF